MTAAKEKEALLWGLVGITLFAATLPMTRLAVGSAEAPQLSPWFVTFGRAAVAGVLSMAYLLWQHTRGQLKVPRKAEWPLVGVTAFGVIVGFPLFLALALRHVPSTHGAVVTALLPLSTAVLGALWFRQRPSNGFWACAVLGSGLVLAYMVWRAGGLYLGAANIYLVIAMTTGAFGYIGGARLTPRLGAEQVICWVLMSSLPLTLPMAWLFAPADVSAIAAISWWGFVYVALFSMWIGFFAWYRALALGAVRVSQIQLVQPFLSLLFAVPLVGERLDGVTLAFALAVIATVYAGKKMPVHQKVPA
ncbi:MAG: multidrug DMT transporter permease [Burkholderiales bacterium RIFCSPLOWO2_12_67_14]|nr:MAG: multidrug DMT transporter permease [Burkholderiales bacterium RIFCSPLOWO2_02_FULL_67_64]OGB39700.1 MAG: multidrug DMT transporter permease [Burkholderiales bacterium RIFCSPLOWO2_12_67_14]OGB41161.1 MAG: multidrug DMT transporter permease [Burkholderiales bacterium RIFCSPHIGHO2_12_FULL_67_38]